MNSRDLIRARAAAGDSDARFVDHVLSQREAGLTRPRTTTEIAAQIVADAVDPTAALNRRRALAGLPPLEAPQS